MAGAITNWLLDLEAGRLDFDGRVLVTLSYAQSLDGSLALERGRGLALSGRESMQFTHRLRAAHDAVLVGIGTLLADDPQLTVRLVEGKNPRPVVLDSQLRTPPGSRLMRREDIKPWIFTANEVDTERVRAAEAQGADVTRLPRNPEGGLDLAEMLRCLGKSGVKSLMVEGGARVITSFLSVGLFDYAAVTIAPVWVGGLRVVETSIVQDNHFPALEDTQYEAFGPDVIVLGRAGSRLAG